MSRRSPDNLVNVCASYHGTSDDEPAERDRQTDGPHTDHNPVTHATSDDELNTDRQADRGQKQRPHAYYNR